MKGRSLVLALTAALVAIASPALAALVEMRFTDTLGAQKAVPAEAAYINPVGDLQVALSAGLERKVMARLIDAAGAEVASQVSGLIGAADKITTAGGSTYYGAVLTLPGPLAEGSYTLQAQILDSAGTEVASEEHPVTVDVTAPVVTGQISWIRSGLSGGSIEIFTNGQSGQEIRLGGISDLSGVVAAKYFTVGPDNQRRETSANIDSATGFASVPVSLAAGTELAPQDRSAYIIGFEITDKAGNKSETTRTSKIDRTIPPYWIEVFDSSQQAWLPYTVGMNVYENPISYRIKMNKVDHIDFNGTDYGLASPYSESDNQYIYWNRSLSYPQNYHHYYVYTKAGKNSSVTPRSWIFTLSGTAEMGPVPTGIEHHLAGNDPNLWGGNTIRSSTPFTVDKIRISAEARSYDQKVWVDSSACVIPAGSTSCEADISIAVSSGKGYSPKAYFASKLDGTFSNQGSNLLIYWDMNKPTINSFLVSKEERTAELRITDHDRVNSWRLYMWDTRTFKLNMTSSRTTLVLQPSLIEEPDYKTKIAKFQLSSVPDGMYSLTAEGIDTYGNTSAVTYQSQVLIDATAPVLSLYRNGQPLGTNEALGDLAEISFTLQDNLDTAPQVSSINLSGGPAGESVNLAWTQNAGGEYKLEYPVMFPSLSAGDYTLSIAGRDWQNNTISKTVTFSYEPLQVALDSATVSAAGLLVPAAVHSFSRPDGSAAIKSEVWTSSSGTPIAGQYDIYASMRSDAQAPLRINGVRLDPGQTMVRVASGYDFAANGGKVNLPLGAAEAGLVGNSSLLITATAPGAPVMVVDVKTWAPNVTLSAGADWDIEQIVEPVQISAAGDAATFCSLTSSAAAAQGADPFVAPACLVEWSASLPGFTADASDAKLTGRAAVEQGSYTVSYTVSMVDRDGSKVALTSGEQQVNVVPATIALAPDKDVSQLIRKLETVQATLKQSAGFACPLTEEPQQALLAATAGELKCLFEWTQLPGQLLPVDNLTGPSFKGSIEDPPGVYDLSWDLKAFTGDGTEVLLASQNHPITVNNPPLPQVSLYSKMGQLPDGTLASSLYGGNFGYTAVTVPRKAADITLELDGFSEGHISVQYVNWNTLGSDGMTTFSRYLKLGEKPLWDRSPVTVTAYYTALPDVRASKTVEVLRVPPERIYLSLETPKEALDDEAIPVMTKIGDLTMDGSLSYDPAIHGSWQVQIGQVTKEDPFVVLTEPVAATDGSMQADLTSLPTGYTVLKAKATINSPDGSYVREIESPRSFFAVFRGASPDAGIISRTLSGPAPFTVVLGLGMDRESRQVLGEILWQYSSDDGANWQELPAGSIAWRTSATFDQGSYLVRAKVQNKKSGEIGYTETVQVQAFHVPKLEVLGPQAALVGGTINITASATYDGAAADAVIEWYNEQEELLGVGASYSVSPTEAATQRYFVRARMADAPADNPSSWVEKRHYVQVKPPASPRGKINVPYYMEAGKTYEFSADLYEPYWGMSETDYPIGGEWTLPDGSVVPGRTIEYTATEADADAGKAPIRFTAWLEGFRAAGTEASLQRDVRTGRYVWPQFEVVMTQRIAQAPSDVILQVNPVEFSGRLESPVYSWLLPASAEITLDYGQRITARFSEPGTFEVIARVRDARGSVAEVPVTVTTVPADPFVIAPSIVPSNKYYHAPLGLTVWPRVSGGHPQDRMSEFRYTLNGQPLEMSTSTGIISGLPAGGHALQVIGASRFGAEAVFETTVEVLENQPPLCEVSNTRLDRDTNPLYVLEAKCSDSDGYVAGYSWARNGKVVNSSYKVGIPIPEPGASDEVKLTVRDNTGGLYQETLTLTP